MTTATLLTTQEQPPALLIVEDDPGVRRSLHLLFKARGFAVRAYASGAMLLDDPAAMDATCLIADYQLPEEDGLCVLRNLRARHWAGPAILITAHNVPNLQQRASEAGFVAVLEKPFRDHQLIDAVARSLAKSAVGATSR